MQRSSRNTNHPKRQRSSAVTTPTSQSSQSYHHHNHHERKRSRHEGITEENERTDCFSYVFIVALFCATVFQTLQQERSNFAY